MDYFNNLKQILKDKDILCIPIISSINRETGEYNLAADGNINRIVTTFWHVDTIKSLTIILPIKNIKGSNSIIESLKSHLGPDKCKIFYCYNFGMHAGEQRSKASVYRGILDELKTCGISLKDEKYTILFESQYLGLNLLDMYNPDKLIFWNYTCELVPHKTRSFLTGYDEINKILYRKCSHTILSSPELVKYYQNYNGPKYYDTQTRLKSNEKIIYCPIFVDRNLPVFSYNKDEKTESIIRDIKNIIGSQGHIWYLPYRMTDEGYQMDKVIDFINSFNEKSVIIYTDPNNSGYMESIKSKFNDNILSIMKCSTSRNTYYTILDSEASVEIPYFEDLPYINHASIQEFIYKDCKALIYLWKNYYIEYKGAYDLYKYPNIKFV